MCLVLLMLCCAMARAPRQGQIFLDCYNPILENAIRPRLTEGKREPCELKVADFDDAMYTLKVLFTCSARCNHSRFHIQLEGTHAHRYMYTLKVLLLSL